MIDIEKHTLRTFKQYACTRLAHLFQAAPYRLGILQHKGRDFAQVAEQALTINWRLAKACT